MAVIEITRDNFQKEVLEAQLPVLLDFWAAWCGPCKMFSPVVDEFAEDAAGKAVVGKVNVDSQPDIAAEYGVMSIPTVILFKNGQAAEKRIGVQSKQELAQLLGFDA